MKKRYLRLVRSAFRALRHRRLRHRSWWRTLTKPLFARSLWVPCRDTVAHGLAIGLFFSMFPPFTPQSVFAAVVAMRARANVPFAMAAAFVSNMVTTPFIILGQNSLGVWLFETFRIPLPPGNWTMGFEVPLPIGEWTKVVIHLNPGAYILGFIISGLLLGLCAYPIVHLFSAIMPHHLPVLRKRHASRIIPQRPSQTGGN